MSTLEELQARATALLTRTESPASIEAKVASTEGPSRRFSPFIPSELDRAIALAGELMKIAEDQDVAAALEEAERRAGVEDVQLVRHAVELFIVHDPEAARLAIPPIPLPSEKRAGARLAGAIGRESALDWFREDPLGNDHHRHWHIVYPARGRPGPGGVQLQDRQGELFFYMHQQMLARYDAERRGLGFGPVVPFADYREPIGEGYEDRPSGQALRDIDRQDTGQLLVSELEEQRDRLLAAVQSGAAENGAGPRPLTSELLGALEEPTAGTLWRDVWHHGYGHVITAFVMAPDGGGEPGDIGDTSTAIRDPFFWRWHRHIDDANFSLQEQATPFVFDDAPAGVVLSDVELAFEADPATPVDELKTMVAKTDDVEHGDHEPLLWRLRASSTTERTVTVRIFLAPADAVEDRRAWIEMDKFEQTLATGDTVIERPGRLASPVRKPADRPPVLVQGPAQTPHEQYCRCGWPYHLLIPRGTPAGMPFRVLVMLTDWELDKVSGDDDCGSMSFCGSRDRYPDTREMGYPFSRPLPGGIAATLEALPTVCARDLTIRHDPKAAGLMGEHDELLRRFTPRLRYDSNEQYFADSPAQWTENPGNELRRTGGTLIARAPDLTLGFLDPETYLDGQKVAKGDYIGDPKRDYRRQYVKLRVARPELNNRVYGRAVEGGGHLWLQYWLWYFYNDYSLALGSGLHEGDWEMVQLRMHDGEPDLAVYAQHTHAEKRPWHEVKTLEGHPLVFVARGSHASYFEAGFHTTEAWYDLADGKRKTTDLELEILDGDGPGWALWTGRWGDTQPRLPGGVHQPSPTGPGAKKQWADPASILDTARVAERHDAPEGPEVSITRAGDWMRIEFDFERVAQPPRSLVVTVNSVDEDGVPPRTYTFTLEDTVSGVLKTRIPTDPAKHYDVYTSTTGGDPPVPSESTLTLLDPVGAGPPKPPLGQRISLRFSRLLAWVRGHLPKRFR